MIRELRVNGMTRPDNIPPDEICLSWQADGENQFTVEMTEYPDWHGTILYTDTRNHYLRYDGFPVRGEQTLYWRVRSGIGEWAMSSFTTGRREK